MQVSIFELIGNMIMKYDNTIPSNIMDNRSNGSVGEFLKKEVDKDSELSIVSAYFTIYAYHKLKDQLDNIKSLRFLFGEPTFIKGVDDTNMDNKSFKIEDDKLNISIDNCLGQKAIANQCAEWIKDKVEIKSMIKPNFLHGKMYHIEKENKQHEAVLGSSNFTVKGLGFSKNSNIELNNLITDVRDRKYAKSWFNELWNDDTGLVEDVKEQVISYIQQIYKEHSPQFIYYKTLYHLFNEHISAIEKQDIIGETIGFYDSEIWNMLYSFQKDAVKGAIEKIQKFNGCIIADSVGLGKTFEALAVIKYFELRSKRVLVLCPKKLRENWTDYLVDA